MTVAYLFDPVKQFVSRSGIPLAGGFLNVFVGESQAPANTFSDAAGTVMNPQNIPIDSAGRALGVFVDDSKLYTLKAYNAGGQLQFSIYPVAPGKGGGGGSGTSYYYPGDEYIHIDQDAREISLDNLKPIRGDEETIHMYDSDGAVIISVNPDLIGNETHVAAGEHTSVDYDSDNNTYTVNANYTGSNTIGINSDGEISGKYAAGYGIEISGGGVIKKTHHKLIATNAVAYNYCKVFDFTWQNVYGRGLCVFTATYFGGDFVTFAVSLTRVVGADYTIANPYVVAASPNMATVNGFVESLEIRVTGKRVIGYLKLRNFRHNQFWLDWEGSSVAGSVSFTPLLTNSPEGDVSWSRSVTNNDVFYSKTIADGKFQKTLTPGDNITIDSDGVISAADAPTYTAGTAIDIDSDNVISNASPVMFSSVLGNPDVSPCSANILAQRNGNSLTYTMARFVNEYGNSGEFLLIPLNLGEGYLHIADNHLSVKDGIPSASSVDSDKVLTVDSDGNPSWANPPKKPVVRSNVAFSATSTTDTTSTWTSPTISAPSGATAMMSYHIYVHGADMTESDQWDVKINGSNWMTGLRGNFSSYVCSVPASGITFTVTGPRGIEAPRISYVIFQEWV